MAILNIGLAKTKEAFQTNLGALATDTYNRHREALDAKAVMDATPDADLVALGFTQDEVTYMKTAVSEMATNATAALANDQFQVYLRGVIGS